MLRGVTLSTCILALAVPTSASAERISIQGHSATQEEGRCNEKGGTFSPTNKSGVYACINPDGSGIVCGGGTEEQKKTCDTFRIAGQINRNRLKDRLRIRPRTKH